MGTIFDAFRYGLNGQAVHEKLLADIDAKLMRLDSGETEESIEQEPSPELADKHNSQEALGGK